MEDVDEGFGSNESNHSNPTKDLQNDLKYLNGQKIIDGDAKLDKLFPNKVRENGDILIGTSHIKPGDTNGDVTHIDLETNGEVNDKKMSEVENDEFSCSLVDVDDESVEELQADVVEARDLEKECENKETELPKVNGHDSCDSADVKDREVGNNHIDKANDNTTGTLNRTPIKQHTSSAEGKRSPFLLDDKVRNSLKGLVAKVKFSEMSREVPSPAGSCNSGDGDSSASKITGQLIEKEGEKDQQNIKDTTEIDNDTSLADADEDILYDDGDDDDEGIPMEIGSDNEDELLELSLENSNTQECNTETEEVSSSEPSDECCKTKSDMELGCPEMEETKTGSFADISKGSDKFGKDFGKNTLGNRHDSMERIQFEEDSNSNGSCGRINEIVDFLNHDLSGTSSPLTTTDSITTDDSNSKIKRDKEDSEAMEKDEKVMKEDNTDVTDQKDTEDNLNDTKIEGLKEESSEKDDAKIEESPVMKHGRPSQKIENSVEVDNHSVQMSKGDQDNENLNSNVDARKSNSGQMELADDDDDVIFEGATMPAMRNEFQTKTLAGSNGIKSAESFTKVENESSNESSKKDGDNDVVFEMETKLKLMPKQDCDKLKTNDNTNSETVKGDTSELRVSLNNRKSSVSDDKTVKAENENSIEKTESQLYKNSVDRKRSAEDKEESGNKSKRSKFDLTGLIGRLGSRVEPASIEVSDSEEDEKSIAVEASKIETKDEKAVEDKKLITLTEKELEDLVREKVKLYLTSQHDTLVAKLSQKVKELQQNNDLWKRQVKDLQVKVNDVTVLQQKLEKRKAATAALRQITTRNVAVQVDEGRTASSRNTKVGSGSPRVTAQVPLVTSPVGNGTIRLPIPQSSVTPAITTQLTQSSKMVTSTYQTPSVKSLLDTTRVQKTVGSVATTSTTTVGTSVIGLLQYPQTYVTKPASSQGFVQQTVTQLPTQVTTTVAKTVTLTSPNASKVIDLTDDDDSAKTRLVAFQSGINTVTNQQGVRHVIAPPGTQFVRTGLPNQQTYQLVFTSPAPAIRPGMMVTMASPVTQTSSLPQTVPQSQTLVSPSPAVAPGTSLARAAVPTITVPQKVPASSHPAPFPALPSQLTTGLKGLPPKPSLKISRVSQGIVLSWNMSLNDSVAEISNYQLFAYQETSAQPVATLWKKVGDVKALPLPMACTLTQFQVGNKYHFAVRAMDIHNRVGQFSDPGSIHLTPVTPNK